MESEQQQQSSISSDLLGTVVRPPSIRVSGSFKSNLSGRLTPRSSPSFRRSPSVRTPSARDFRPSAPPPLPWYHKLVLSRRLVPWLVVIGLWAYIGLLLQSRWAHNDGQGTLHSQLKEDQDAASRVFREHQETVQHDKISHRNVSDVLRIQPLTRTDKGQHLEDSLSSERTQGYDLIHSRITTQPRDLDVPKHDKEPSPNISSWIFPSIGAVNASVGTFVGPFQDLQKSTLGSIRSDKLGSCSDKGAFAEYVQARSFMLVFHELSMTGSPLAMLELANEILNCHGKVVVVALSQKGGLLPELLARRIKVLKSKAAATFKAAASVDTIVAGSAVCASWIEKYVLQNKKGPKRLVWWIMENRREYFDRSKHMLGLAKALIFLSEAQLKKWITWSQSEDIALPQKNEIVPLCVNEELSLRAGLYEGAESTLQQLRDLVRQQMGLKPHDVLFTTLSSINPGKGQLKLLQAVAMVVENFEGSSKDGSHTDSQTVKDVDFLTDEGHNSKGYRLRLLIGSVGSKSNKVDYIQKLLEFIGDHPRLAEVILWTPATVHVASLYAASDVYVMNSQGLGETFGRVTVEAMAFSLPILGTSAGGTSEIVDNSESGLLHPTGADGVPVLAQHISMLLKNATLRENMGLKGKDKVKQIYLKETMYGSLGKIFSAA